MSEPVSETDWNLATVRRPRGENLLRGDLRYGKDVAPEVGMFFQVPWSRPMHLTSMTSPYDGGVVTHSLQAITDKGESWTLDEDSFNQKEFASDWKHAVIFPPFWRFVEDDYLVGMNPEHEAP